MITTPSRPLQVAWLTTLANIVSSARMLDASKLPVSASQSVSFERKGLYLVNATALTFPSGVFLGLYGAVSGSDRLLATLAWSGGKAPAHKLAVSFQSLTAPAVV